MATTRIDPSDTAALQGFRDDFYGCLDGWRDALFELTDALLCCPSPVTSVPHLSLEAVFRRSHGSLYKALARGGVDAQALRELLVDHRPDGWPAVFAVDASTWDRCHAETSPERGFYYHASKHSAGQPIVAGWSYQWVSQLDWAPDSWTAPVDARRLPVGADTTDATIAQVRDLLGLLGDDGDVPLFVLDAGYDPIGLSAGLAADRAQVLVRIRNDRVFHSDPPERVDTTVGRPRRHGDRFACNDPDTWPPPDDELRTDDPRYGSVRVAATPGMTCTPSSVAVAAGPTTTARRSSAAPSSASPSNACPGPPAATSRPCGCGGPDPASPTSTCAGAPTCAASTSNTPIPVRQEHSGLDHPVAGHPRPGRPVDLARGRRLHPATPGPRPRRRPPPPLGTTPRPRQAHPRPHPQRISKTWRDHRHPRQTTEIRHARPRTPQRPRTGPRPRYPAIKKAARPGSTAS